jgi:aspartyl-tRNA(Asn)/glutamyl-tRNA(Gln) amidotransferase subunit A
MSQTGVAYLSIGEILRAYRGRELSPVEYLDHVLARIDAHNPVINAFFHVDAEGARAQAKESERRWLKGSPAGPLDGIPFSLKDNIATRGMPSPLGLKVKAGAPPAKEDAPVVARLREAGAIPIGKNTQPELACLTGCISGLYGIGRNPWDTSKTPGGSSGGSAAALAADMVPLTIGGDSGGSIRIPASYTGVVGLKPSFGRVPRSPPAASAAVQGPMTRKAADLPLVMNAITRPDKRDVYSLPYDGVDYTQACSASLKGKRIAVSEWFGFGLPTVPEVSAVFRGALDSFRRLGAEVCAVAPLFDYDPYEGLAPMVALGFSELATAATDGAVDSLLPEIQTWASRGKSVTAQEYMAAHAVGLAVVVRVSEALEDFDYIVTPTVPTFPGAAERGFPEGAPLNRFGHTMSHFPFTWPFNFSGHPAISVPCGFGGGMPVGLQIVGNRFDDVGCISAAIAFEATLGLPSRRPPLLS